jgi:hypothetical protein
MGDCALQDFRVRPLVTESLGAFRDGIESNQILQFEIKARSLQQEANAATA